MDRHFHSESSYHEKADDALNKIQDTLEFYFEDNPKLAPNTDINFSSGVLTIGLPHGTWVLNKQTPVRQKILLYMLTCIAFFFLVNTSFVFNKYIDLFRINKSGGRVQYLVLEGTNTKK